MLSASEGIPVRPSRADTAPSCMWPPAASEGSSSWQTIGVPRSLAYSSARRMTAAVPTGRPSSLNATAPAAASACISARRSPAWPSVTAAIGSTRQCATFCARASSHSIHSTRSMTGFVFGMQAIEVNPPAAAAAVPVATVSFALCPGSRRWTCRSTKPGASTRPCASNASAPAGSGAWAPPPTRAITPSFQSRSMRSPLRQWRAPRIAPALIGRSPVRQPRAGAPRSAPTRRGSPAERPPSARGPSRRRPARRRGSPVPDA